MFLLLGVISLNQYRKYITLTQVIGRVGGSGRRIARWYLHRRRRLLQDKYGEAEALYVRSIDIFERTVGPGHRSTAVSLSNLAGALQAQVRNRILPCFSLVTNSFDECIAEHRCYFVRAIAAKHIFITAEWTC